MCFSRHKLKASAMFALAFFVGHSTIAAEVTDIRTALSGHTAFETGKAYRPWRQYFAADGTTVYFGDGPSSLGKWEPRGNQYCSLWPPVEEWACYDVEFSNAGLTVTWIAKDGSRTSGDLFDGDQTALRAPPNR
jgi:hypothetical protein